MAAVDKGFRLLDLAAPLLALCCYSAIAQTGEPPDEATAANDEVYVKLSSRKYQELEGQFNRVLDAYAARRISEDELASRFSIFSRSYGLESRFDAWVGAYPKSYA